MTRLLSTSAVSVILLLSVPAHAQDAVKIAPPQGEQCNQNWTTVDSDKSGTVSEDEAKAVADAAFARIDVDRNGTVSVTEWKDCGDPESYPGNAGADKVPASANTGSAAASATRTDTAESAPWTADDFGSFDTDKSGDLSADEAAEASHSGGARQDDEDAARRFGAMFSRVDENGDGKMSAEEWSNRNQQTFNDLFARVDIDSNGEISRDEWKQYRDGGYTRAAGGEGQEPTIWRYYYFVVG